MRMWKNLLVPGMFPPKKTSKKAGFLWGKFETLIIETQQLALSCLKSIYGTFKRFSSHIQNQKPLILLMVRSKSGVHQLRLVVDPIILRGFHTSLWLFGIYSIDSKLYWMGPSNNRTNTPPFCPRKVRHAASGTIAAPRTTQTKHVFFEWGPVVRYVFSTCCT